MTVFLIPTGRDCYELYSEAPEAETVVTLHAGRLGRLLSVLRAHWTLLVRDARAGADAPGWTGWWHRRVCGIDDRVAEQRTLWGLRDRTSATLVHPSDLPAASAREHLDALLLRDRRRHGGLLLMTAAALVVTGALALLPGPNLVAYYFAARLVGHLLSWRGAGQGLARTRWEAHAEPALTELRALAAAPRSARAAGVEAIGVRLRLPRLAAFFDRAVRHTA